jgi:hypothetical protein
MAAAVMKLEQHDVLGNEASLLCPAMDEQVALNCISVMLRIEEQYVCHDYLDDKPPPFMPQEMANVMIDESCRSKMCEWIFHVIDSTRLQRETASVAMSFLDRFLCSSSERASKAKFDRREYQLAAITCLYIAVKLHEPFEMDAGLMSKLSRGVHSAEDITTMEYDILVALQWKMNGPTPFQFVNYILVLLPDSARSVAPELYENSHFQTELAVGDYAFVPHLRKSTVAVASILNSLASVERESLQFSECIQFVRSISEAFELDIDSELFNTVRERLLESFAKSSGYELSQGPMPIPRYESCNKSCNNDIEESPACVAKEMAFSLGN